MREEAAVVVSTAPETTIRLCLIPLIPKVILSLLKWFPGFSRVGLRRGPVKIRRVVAVSWDGSSFRWGLENTLESGRKLYEITATHLCESFIFIATLNNKFPTSNKKKTYATHPNSH